MDNEDLLEWLKYKLLESEIILESDNWELSSTGEQLYESELIELYIKEKGDSNE